MSMTRWLKRRGAIVSVADTRADPPHAASLSREWPAVAIETGEFREHSLRAADMIAISPGIDRRTLPVAAAIRHGVPVAGDIELFAQALPALKSSGVAKHTPKILAITGTNGKSTVTCMAGDICQAGGFATVVAGNIGKPVLDTLAEIEDGAAMPDAFVLELSSFQLESTISLNADAATMLNLSEDHMDRYDRFEDYVAAKARVFHGSGTQVLNDDDAYSRAMALPGRAVHRFALAAPAGDKDWGMASRVGAPYLSHGGVVLLAQADLPVSGMHNAANALAAGALCHAIGVDDAAIVHALRNFRGLPHRVTKVAEFDGVAFYDDSKGTNVGATVAALDGSTQTVVLIAGGDGKGQDFTPLNSAVKKRARAVVLIGRDSELIAAALSDCGVPLVRADDMRGAVKQAYSLCRHGDAVLLSPACASFDMFRNYAHRGDEFVSAVRTLVGRDDR
jgi:UDP-N-acetylmuramoylalanine--D-glutamate ligase